jgi:hypothetical protein
VPIFLQMWCSAFKPKSSILVSSDQRILFPMVWVSLGAFYWGVASVWPLYHKCLIGGAAEMVVLLEGSPISTEEL